MSEETTENSKISPKTRREILAERIGTLIKIRRLQLGIKQNKLASMISCSVGQVSFYESGRNMVPLDVLLEICRVLDYDFHKLIEMAQDDRKIVLVAGYESLFPDYDDDEEKKATQ